MLLFDKSFSQFCKSITVPIPQSISESPLDFETTSQLYFKMLSARIWIHQRQHRLWLCILTPWVLLIWYGYLCWYRTKRLLLTLFVQDILNRPTIFFFGLTIHVNYFLFLPHPNPPQSQQQQMTFKFFLPRNWLDIRNASSARHTLHTICKPHSLRKKEGKKIVICYNLLTLAGVSPMWYTNFGSFSSSSNSCCCCGGISGSLNAFTINRRTSVPTELLTHIVESQAILYSTSVGFNQHNWKMSLPQSEAYNSTNGAISSLV